MAAKAENAGIEMWGGVECTINRIGESYFSQCAKSSHDARLSDLDLIASLNIKKLRYPILWEHLAPENCNNINWAWADERLNKLRELGIEPIVTLVHHGSGPKYATFDSEEFITGFADFAGKVAERYPWLRYFTPVNEPLTTARFAGLYGVWFPHKKDSRSFARIFVNQCKAVRAAMCAIRKHIPEAKLVQTEDLGYTHSTPKLKYQAEFENKRRWLTYDLLSGKVNPQHALWNDLVSFGLSEEELLSFANNPCIPDIIGINHYVTSERYLDQRLSRYPKHAHGGNAWHRYADVEAVRVRKATPVGAAQLFLEAGKRYQLPIAITEVHMACARAEQLRWIQHIWEACKKVKAQGINVVGFTPWSLFGAYDWDSLLSCSRGHYESGVFDLRASSPRPTSLAKMIYALATKDSFMHPVLESPGWWQKNQRIIFGRTRQSEMELIASKLPAGKPVLISGATGTLGSAFARICEEQGIAFRLLHRHEMDIANAESVQKAIAHYKPWAIINTAGYVRVDDAETDEENCFRENTTGPIVLANICAAENIKLVTFSTDLVFDGAAGDIFTETSPVAPKNVYARTKAEAENRVSEINSSALIIRTSAFFGPWDEHNFVYHALKTLSEGKEFEAAADAKISPTYVPDLVKTALDLLIDDETGIWHLANKGRVTWAALAKKAAIIAKLNPALVKEKLTADFGFAAYRPLCTVLDSEKSSVMPALEPALEHCVQAVMQRLRHQQKTEKHLTRARV